MGIRGHWRWTSLVGRCANHWKSPGDKGKSELLVMCESIWMCRASGEAAPGLVTSPVEGFLGGVACSF